MARDDMTGSEFQSMVGYKPSTGGYGSKLKAAESAHTEKMGDPKYIGGIMENLHNSYHANDDPSGAWHDRIARTAQNFASMHARATGKTVSTVLQDHDFHPVTGHSMRPKPETPTHEVIPGRRVMSRPLA